MKPLPGYSLFCILLFTLLSSCKKDNPKSVIPPPPPVLPANVYVLGTQGDVALYWKNGVPTRLDSQAILSYGFSASSLAVSNNQVYVSGARSFLVDSVQTGIPQYWVNGLPNILPDSSGNAFGNAVFVSGTNVYVSGTTGYPDTSHTVFSTLAADYPQVGNRATIWQGGMPVSLPGYGVVGLIDSSRYAVRIYSDYVNSIVASGADIYVCGGSYWEGAHASYWKNGERIDLTSGLTYVASNGINSYPTSTSLAVSGSDVYVSGFELTSVGNTLALYWKNGTPQFLSTDSIGSSSTASSVFISGSDVYVAGSENINGYSRAIVWKNGMPTFLTNGSTSSTAYAVRVLGNDVYVAGGLWVAPHPYMAVYWKNGIPVSLTDGSVSAIAYSIQVEYP